ncbi:hypothetical protein ARTHRO_40949 [Limnospira indica PCC 8005]|uniref:Uncharacterized protein n=1 Tax=Limnospira indica PCC 8005 TaxID=376219 RepID=A0A9P1P052_9CYAN|nr:hypothetical protein ARTHRO_40949 [Limnospira indica PCC 8005]
MRGFSSFSLVDSQGGRIERRSPPNEKINQLKPPPETAMHIIAFLSIGRKLAVPFFSKTRASPA